MIDERLRELERAHAADPRDEVLALRLEAERRRMVARGPSRIPSNFFHEFVEQLVRATVRSCGVPHDILVRSLRELGRHQGPSGP